MRHITLSGIEFIHRFLQHVLPRGVTKLRYYGIFSPSSKSQLERARQLLTPVLPHTDLSAPEADFEKKLSAPRRCPVCRVGVLVLF